MRNAVHKNAKAKVTDNGVTASFMVAHAMAPLLDYILLMACNKQHSVFGSLWELGSVQVSFACTNGRGVAVAEDVILIRQAMASYPVSGTACAYTTVSSTLSTAWTQA